MMTHKPVEKLKAKFPRAEIDPVDIDWHIIEVAALALAPFVLLWVGCLIWL